MAITPPEDGAILSIDGVGVSARNHGEVRIFPGDVVVASQHDRVLGVGGMALSGEDRRPVSQGLVVHAGHNDASDPIGVVVVSAEHDGVLCTGRVVASADDGRVGAAGRVSTPHRNGPIAGDGVGVAHHHAAVAGVAVVLPTIRL